MPTLPANLISLLQSARVLVVGDTMLDRYWFGEVERISPEAPVPVAKIERMDQRAGGAGNVAPTNWKKSSKAMAYKPF